jgi:hypothetical protein
LLRIEITVSRGDAKFLLSALVQPRTIGPGMPVLTGGTTSTGTGSTGASSSGNFTPVTSTSATAYPFIIVDLGENLSYE